MNEKKVQKSQLLL